ncbi:MAG TPA: hypothetical protein VIY51_16405 [Xanthobacteraceae bacterium]
MVAWRAPLKKAPGRPLLGNPLAAIQRRDRPPAGNLPLVDVQVLVDRSAARKERLRPVLFANLSSRLFAAELTRTVNVAEGMDSILCLIV